MGVTIRCKRTGRSIDLGCGGFANLREKVAELCGDPWASHYAKLSHAPYSDKEAKAFYKEFDKETAHILKTKKVSVKIVDFCLQSDCEGSIRYGACKQILKVIADYDDNICYGYVGRPDCAMFRDFKTILQECVKSKCDMVWS